jgi:hypothetical protein
MLGEDKSGDQPRQRSRKAAQRERKAARQQNPKPDQRAEDQADATGSVMASIDAAMMEALGEGAPAGDSAPADAPVTGEAAAAVTTPTAAAGENLPVGIQTIANAYRDCFRKSFQENLSFVERLMGVRSMDKAIEVQVDFARQVYADFVGESQRICGLYNELARQAIKPWAASLPR